MSKELIVNRFVYFLSTAIFKTALLLWNRLKVKGVENIPNTGGILIASNHASYLDPPIIGVGYQKRLIHFMARSSLWKTGFSNWWFTRVGCIPIARETGDIKALKLSIQVLKSGGVLSIFPEGTRSFDGEIKKSKSGIGFIIEKSKCTVVPAYIHKSHKALPKGSKWIRPIGITISFGLPITSDEFLALGSGRNSYESHADLIMERIIELQKNI